MHVQKLGKMRYLPAWELQKTIAARVKANVKEGKEAGHTLLLLEHYPG